MLEHLAMNIKQRRVFSLGWACLKAILLSKFKKYRRLYAVYSFGAKTAKKFFLISVFGQSTEACCNKRKLIR